MDWGNEYYSSAGPRRLLLHATGDGQLDQNGRCAVCGQAVPVDDTLSAPGPGTEIASNDDGMSITSPARTYHLLQPTRILCHERHQARQLADVGPGDLAWS